MKLPHPGIQVLLVAAIALASLGMRPGDTRALTSPAALGSGIWALVIDPATPGTLYAGTERSGVLRSTNAGKTWVAKNNGLFVSTPTAVYALAISPSQPGTLYAGLAGNVFRTTNGGRKWTGKSVDAGNFRAIAVDPTNPLKAYAASDSSGVFRTINGGVKWTYAGSGIPAGTTIWDLYVHPTNPNILYAATSVGVYKTINAGKRWTAKNSGITGPVYALAARPDTPNRMYAGGETALYASSNGGGAWKAPLEGVAGLRDFTDVIIDPKKPGTAYAANISNGVFKTTTNGDKWALANAGLSDNSVWRIVVNPKAPLTLYAATKWGTIWKTTNGAKSWTPLT